ncbi:hypothetical protein FHG87_018095 [Trinorchestia longiramus]|nr:hypothetical protein FHG87_018095 [Trinorchestia longiramus]
MKQSSGSSNGVITFRKVVLNSTSSSSGTPAVANGALCYAGNTIAPQVMNNGVLIPTVAGVATNGSLFHPVNGSSGTSCAATHNVSVGTMLASSSNGLATSVAGSTIATINANGVLQSSLANGNTTIRTQNGKIITATNVVSAAPTTTGGKLCLTQQQLQKLLEQQLQQQPQQGSHPQIIRLQNPQQQLIRLQQPQQVVRLQQPTQTQIIRIAPNKLQQGHQLPDGRIIFPQPIQITPQQLQQLQQRQHTPIAIQPLQLQPQQPQVVLPGVQLVSVANAHALLEKQQQQSISLTNEVVAATSQHSVPSQQFHLPSIQSQLDNNPVSQPQQFLSTAANQGAASSLGQNNLVSANGIGTSHASMLTGFSQSNTKESQSLQSPLGEVELNVLSTNQETESEGTKASQLTNGEVEQAQENTQPKEPCAPEQQDNDDDDIQEVGQVINTISNGIPVDALKNEEPAKKEEDEEGGSEPDPGVIDIVINNVVCSYSVGCHINLRDIATLGSNVEYRREHGYCVAAASHFTAISRRDDSLSNSIHKIAIKTCVPL